MQTNSINIIMTIITMAPALCGAVWLVGVVGVVWCGVLSAPGAVPVLWCFGV